MYTFLFLAEYKYVGVSCGINFGVIVVVLPGVTVGMTKEEEEEDEGGGKVVVIGGGGKVVV
jgi:hypothetical protein